MSDDPTSDSVPEDDVGRLVKLAGARRAPPADIEDSVRAAFHRDWRDALNARRVRRTQRQLLVASLVSAAIGLTWVGLRSVDQSPVATLVASRGAVHITSAADRSIMAGDALPPGTHVQTDAGAMVLLQAGTVSIRVGPATHVDLERSDRLRLSQGKLYVDSGPRPAHDTLQIATFFGNVSHLGTQYQVQVVPGQFMLTSVREGQVSVDMTGRSRASIVESGQGLRISQAGEISPINVSPYDTSWNWVNGLVPDFSIDGRSFAAFLDWYARETGRTLVFVPPANRAGADRATLNGSIAGLTPEQALDAVVPTTRFQCDVSRPGQVRISLSGSGAGTMERNVPSTAPNEAHQP